MVDPFDMSNIEVLITGGLGQIGKIATKAVVDRGGKVVIWDVKKKDEFSELVKMNPEYEEKVFYYQVDIACSTQVKESVNKAFSNHNLTTLLHLAAIDAKFECDSPANEYPFHEFPQNQWEKTCLVNVNGLFHVTKSFINKLIELNREGNLVLTASTYSFVAPNQELYLKEGEDENSTLKPIDYVATKSMIPNYARYLATMYAKNNIRVNTFSPHGVRKDHDENFKKRFAKLSPMGRMCEAEELVGPLVFLLSNASSYMNGSSLLVDGGWTAW